MNASSLLQIGLFLVVLLLLVKPLGWYMARVYEGKTCGLDWAVGWLERLLYRLCRIDPTEEMSWTTYAKTMLVFNLLGFAAVYALQRLQHLLPLNPQNLAAVPPDLAMNTAVSFATNTNWQSYGGETTLSYLTQMLGLSVQNFLSAATGMAVLVALIRGFARRSAQTIGNFWYDLTRGTLYILLPLSMIGAIVLVSQGVVQTLRPYQTVTLTQPTKDADGKAVTEQTLAVGPAASQVMIKQLGTNGGGFFNVNSAHPLENPTPLSGLIEIVSILLIAGGLCYTFGQMIGDRRQGWAVLAAMLVFAIIAVFVAGLMVGRTPEYLGKKIEAFEMKMAALVILIPPLLVLVGAAVAVATDWGKAGIANPGPHGFSEILYAFSSASNNNGSAFAGLSTNTKFYNIALGLAMLAARYWLAIPTLAIAGSLARKKATPVSAGTLPTHTPLFVVLLVGTVLLVGALTFIPALALGPVVEQLMMMAG